MCVLSLFAEVGGAELLDELAQGLDLAEIGALFGLHGVDLDGVEQCQLVQVLVHCCLVAVIRRHFDSLRHEVGGDDVLDLLRVLFLVVDPAHELVVVDRVRLGQGDDLRHRLLDRGDVLLDELDAEFVIVDPPTGAKVPELPEQTAVYEEDGETVYQYDKTYYAKASAEEGGQGHVVQSPPPEEKIAGVPADAVTFKVDGETYYYVENSLYVDDTQGGYLNAEPPMDGIAQEIPEGATVVQEGGKMYFQFDTVFFEQVTSGSGTTYKVVPPPRGVRSGCVTVNAVMLWPDEGSR